MSEPISFCPSCGQTISSGIGTGAPTACPTCHVSLISRGPLDQMKVARPEVGPLPELSGIGLPAEFHSRYTLQEPLGRGAVGLVLKAQNISTGQTVAVKILTRLDSPGIVARFMQEGKLLMTIDHPNVVRVYDLQEGEGCAYLVCEYLPGGTLRAKLASGDKIPWRQAGQYTIECLAGLQTCHERGIIHRDLKPENLLFSADGVLKLADFGIAKDHANKELKTRTGETLGTPQYMAPEQIRGLSPMAASDLYAVGLMIYEMIAGRRPFECNDVFGLLMMQMTKKPPSIQDLAPDCPWELAAVVHRALAKDPKDRPASAEQLASPIRLCLSRADGEFSPPPAPVDSEKPPEPTVEAVTPQPVPEELPVEAPSRAPLIVALLIVAVVTIGPLLRVLGLTRKPTDPASPAQPSASAVSPAAPASPTPVAPVPTSAPTVQPSLPATPQSPAPTPQAASPLAATPEATADEEALFRRAVALRPRDVTALVPLGSLLLQKGRPQEAEPVFKQALAINPSHGEALNMLGVTLMRLSRAPEAEQCFQKAVDSNPADAAAHHNLGWLLESTGKLEVAARHYRTTMALNPADTFARRRLGVMLATQGQSVEAEKLLRSAEAAEPQDVETLVALAEVLDQQKRSGDGVAYARRAVQLSPGSAPARKKLGVLLQKQGARDAAEVQLKLAAGLESRNVQDVMNLATALLTSGKTTEAEECLKAAIDLDPRNGRAHAMLGRLLKITGRIAEAGVELQRAMALSPDDAEARKDLEAILLEHGQTSPAHH